MDDRLKHKIVLAREHFERREFEHAEPLLLQVLEKNERLADVLNMLGIVRHERGDFVGAREAFERAVASNPSYTEAQLNLVVTLNDLGDYEAGRKVYAQVRATANPGTEGAVQDPYALGKIANMHADIAKAYADAGYLVEAVTELTKAVALRPAFADLHVKLGMVQRDRGELAAACEAFRHAATQNPRYVPAWVQLGVTLFMREDNAAAREAFQRALEVDPEDKIAKMYTRLVDEKSKEG